MQSRFWILSLVSAALFASTSSNAQEAIGNATTVKPQAEANSRSSFRGAAVYSKELICHWGCWGCGFQISRQL